VSRPRWTPQTISGYTVASSRACGTWPVFFAMNVYVPAGNFVLDRLILNWFWSWSRPAASRYSSRRPAGSPGDPRILHAALVYVNTLMIQDVLAEPAGPGPAPRWRTGAA